MGTFRERLGTAPLWVLALYFGVTFTLGTYGLSRLTGTPESWPAAAVGGVVFAGLMTAWMARRRRREGGATQSHQVATAVNKGRLPADPDPETWGPALDRQERTFRKPLRWAPWEFGAFALLAAALAISEGPVWWAFVAFWITVGTFSVVVSHRTLAKIERMKRELAEEQPSDA